jgi:hypothetical protein
MNFNLQPNILIFTYYIFGHDVAPLVEVAGSIPDGVTGVFPWHNPSGRTIMALGSIRPLTEMSTGNISWWVKAIGA